MYLIIIGFRLCYSQSNDMQVDINSYELIELVHQNILSIDEYWSIRNYVNNQGVIQSHYELVRIGLEEHTVRQLMKLTYVSDSRWSGYLRTVYDDEVSNFIRISYNDFSIRYRNKEGEAHFLLKHRHNKADILIGNIQNPMTDLSFLNRDQLNFVPNWSSQNKTVIYKLNRDKASVAAGIYNLSSENKSVFGILRKSWNQGFVQSKFLKREYNQHRHQLSHSFSNFNFNVGLWYKDLFLESQKLAVVFTPDYRNNFVLEQIKTADSYSIRYRHYIKIHRFNTHYEYRLIDRDEFVKHYMSIALNRRYNYYTCQVSGNTDLMDFQFRYLGKLLIGSFSLRHILQVEKAEFFNSVCGFNFNVPVRKINISLGYYQPLTSSGNAISFYSNGLSHRINRIDLTGKTSLCRLVLSKSSRKTELNILMDLFNYTAQQEIENAFKVQIIQEF